MEEYQIQQFIYYLKNRGSRTVMTIINFLGGGRFFLPELISIL